MLERLQIKNFAIIEDIVVEFDDNMNVLTGETGAGKSIIIDALALLLGNRSSYDKIRNGCDKAFIEGTFRVDNPRVIRDFNKQYDLEIDDDILIVSRVLDASQRTTMKLNGKSIPLSIAKELMSHIVDIHSQHKNDSYINSVHHLRIYDEYLFTLISDKEKGIFNRYQELFKDYQHFLKEYQELESTRLSDNDLDYLRFQYDELCKAELHENEVEDLEAKLKSVASYTKTLEIMESVKEPFSRAFDDLYLGKKLLSQLHDDNFDNLITRFEEGYYELQDAYDEIVKKFDNLNFNPYEIEAMKERHFFLRNLMRKYGSSTAEMIKFRDDLEQQLDTYANYDYNLKVLKDKLEAKKKEVFEFADKLSEIRIKYAAKLEDNVNCELNELLLNNAEFKVDFKDSSINDRGNQSITFMMKANLGGKFLPLEETASLGETSRLNLALKIVFNALNPVETIVFDEIDTGVSGKVAAAIGTKIKTLSKSSQTIVITHLAQVASKAEHQYKVSKKIENGTTKTVILPLSTEERIDEIASLLSSDVIDNNARDLAKKMLSY